MDALLKAEDDDARAQRVREQRNDSHFYEYRYALVTHSMLHETGFLSIARNFGGRIK